MSDRFYNSQRYIRRFPQGKQPPHEAMGDTMPATVLVAFSQLIAGQWSGQDEHLAEQRARQVLRQTGLL